MRVFLVAHIPRSGFMLSSVIRLPSGAPAEIFPVFFFPNTPSLDSTQQRASVPLKPPLCDWELLRYLSNNISCEACVLVPTAPYPTTKHCFVSMLLSAPIQSRCIVKHKDNR